MLKPGSHGLTTDPSGNGGPVPFLFPCFLQEHAFHTRGRVIGKIDLPVDSCQGDGTLADPGWRGSRDRASVLRSPSPLPAPAPPDSPQPLPPPPRAVLYSAGVPGSPSRERASSRAQRIGVPSPPAAAGPSTKVLCAGLPRSPSRPRPPPCAVLLQSSVFLFQLLRYYSAWMGGRKDLEAGRALESEGTALTSLGVFCHIPLEQTRAASLLGLWPLPAQDTSQKSPEHRVGRE